MSTVADGILVIDKPPGPTSRDVVNEVQKSFPRRTRIGHAGTLDPLATGVLVVCVGRATRLIEYIQDMPKSYRSLFRLGARSDTDDAEGVIESVGDGIVPSGGTVQEALRGFLGEIEQVPPTYSAAKVDGRRAYSMARRGETIGLAPRRVSIYDIQMLAYDYPHLELKLCCGKGTYIRALARDLGQRLGCGGIVETLRRTQVGIFTDQNAIAFDSGESDFMSHLRPSADAVAHLPRIALTADRLARLCQGQRVVMTEIPTSSATAAGSEIAVYSITSHLAAIAVRDGEMLVPYKVLQRF